MRTKNTPARKFYLALWTVCLIALPGNFGLAQTLGEALNATNLTWTTSTNAPWFVETNVTFDGVAAVQDGAVTNGGLSWIQATVTGPGAVDFWWKSNSTTNSSWFYFVIYEGQGRNQLAVISGDVDWHEHNFLIPPGPQTLLWTYTPYAPYGAGLGNVWLANVSIGQPLPPAVAIQPTNQVVPAGQPASFTAVASGTEPFEFQWLENGTNISAATSGTLTLTNIQAADSGGYSVAVTSQFGAITSLVATLTVAPSLPNFTLQPNSQTTILGSNLVFTAAATGTEPITWQWLLNGSPVTNATNSALFVTNLQSADIGDYTVVAMNQVGLTTSQVATVTVVFAPVFTQQPLAQGAPITSTISFPAVVEGSGLLNWHWFFKGSLVAGATTSTLLVTNVQSTNFGNYWAIVTNLYGSATSAVVTLSYSPVLIWGDPSFGQTAVNPGATNVVALVGGDYHELALRSDGTVIAWGSDEYAGMAYDQAEVPPEATNVTAIAAGSASGLAVRTDGSLVEWGYIFFQGIGTLPTDVTNLAMPAVGTGAEHRLALRKDGTVVDWGFPSFGVTNPPIAATNIVSVSAGAFHGVALRADGNVVVWGASTSAGDPLQVPAGATNIVAVASGWYQDLVLRADGTLVAWTGRQAAFEYPSLGTVPAEATNIVAIACGGRHNLALRADGKLLAWGLNDLGQTNVPVWATNIVAIAGTSEDSLALVGEGPPIINSPMVDRSVPVGGTVFFRATAVGQLPLSYQWQFNGTNLPGATSNVLIISNAQPAQMGSYSMVASNAVGLASSKSSFLAVLTPQAVILGNSVGLTNDRLGFMAVSPIGQVWTVQASRDLANWTDLLTLTNSNGTMTFADSSTNLNLRFYRMRQVQ